MPKIINRTVDLDSPDAAPKPLLIDNYYDAEALRIEVFDSHAVGRMEYYIAFASTRAGEDDTPQGDLEDRAVNGLFDFKRPALEIIREGDLRYFNIYSVDADGELKNRVAGEVRRQPAVVPSIMTPPGKGVLQAGTVKYGAVV